MGLPRSAFELLHKILRHPYGRGWPYQGLIMKNAVDNGVNLRKVGRDRIGITVDERTRPATLEAVWRAFGGYKLVYSDEHPTYRLPARSFANRLFDPSGLHKNRLRAR